MSEFSRARVLQVTSLITYPDSGAFSQEELLEVLQATSMRMSPDSLRKAARKLDELLSMRVVEKIRQQEFPNA